MKTRAWPKEKITNLKSSYTIIPIIVGLTFWTSLWGPSPVYEFIKAQVFETILQFDCCCLCKCMQLYCGCWSIPTDNKRRIIEHIRICFPWEKKWLRLHIRMRADSGNIDKHFRRAMRAMDITWQPLQLWRRRMCSICSKAKARRVDWKCCQFSEWVCKNHFVKKI
jgi:hypothetical protein